MNVALRNLKTKMQIFSIFMTKFQTIKWTQKKYFIKHISGQYINFLIFNVPSLFFIIIKFLSWF